MAAIKETIIAGALIFEKLINRKSVRKGEKRAAKNNVTAEEVEKVNRRNSEKTLQIKLHHNFLPGDYHLVLTYGGECPTAEEAQAEFDKFLARLRRRYKKLGLEFKWIMVTEYKNKRPHHHLILNQGLDRDTIQKVWGNGFIHDRRLDDSGDWRKLGEYLMKETDKTFRNPDAPSKLRYSCSRNLSMPIVYREEISVSALLSDPEPIKGYYIDQDSIYRGVNPLTERPYMEYVMLPLEETKLRKRFNNRKRVKYKADNHDKLLREITPRQMEIPF